MPNKVLLDILYKTFNLIHRFDKRQPSSFSPEVIRKALIINTTGIGDTLLSTPAIRAIRFGLSGAKTAILVSPKAKEVLINNPYIDEIIEHPGRVDLFYLIKIPRLLLALVKGKFDLVVVLHANDPDVAPLTYITGAPYRIGWKESKLSFLFNMPVETKFLGMHGIDIKLRNLAIFGIKTHGKNMDLFLTQKEREKALDFLEHHGIRDNNILGIHPFGSNKNKWWPEENVARFCYLVKKELSYTSIIFGGKREAKFAKAIAQRSKFAPLIVAGELPLRESAALIQRCRFFVSTDSGPLHISQALGIPTVALFGPSDPAQTGPIELPHRVIQKRQSCVPCRSRECDRDMECMKAITPEEVMDVLKDFDEGERA